jgi:hypothetical protein
MEQAHLQLRMSSWSYLSKLVPRQSEDRVVNWNTKVQLGGLANPGGLPSLLCHPIYPCHMQSLERLAAENQGRSRIGTQRPQIHQVGNLQIGGIRLPRRFHVGGLGSRWWHHLQPPSVKPGCPPLCSLRHRHVHDPFQLVRDKLHLHRSQASQHAVRLLDGFLVLRRLSPRPLYSQ